MKRPRAVLATAALGAAATALPVAAALSASPSLPPPSTDGTPNPAPNPALTPWADYPPSLRSKISGSVAKAERRARERERHVARPLCPGGCGRPPSLCLCGALPPGNQPLPTSTKIVVLQHPSEFRRRNLSTVPLLQKVLLEVTVSVGYSFDDAFFDGVFGGGDRPLLLYPSDGAVDLGALVGSRERQGGGGGRGGPSCGASDAATAPRGRTLVVVDGTWSEAGRIMRRSPALLERCTAVQFDRVEVPSIYGTVRREPDEDTCMSTLEATARALSLLEGAGSHADAVAAGLDKVLRRHVECHLANALGRSRPRHQGGGRSDRRMREREKRRKQIEGVMFPTLQNGDGGDSTAKSRSPVASEDGTASNRKFQLPPLPTPTVTTPTTPFAMLSDGAMVRRLRADDVPLIKSWWGRRSKASLARVAGFIASGEVGEAGGLGACLGVQVGGVLCACILRYPGGALGMLYVDPGHRRRGYGNELVRIATEAVEKRGETCWALILEGNEASESLFEKNGYIREDPSLKKKTGRRRANRKWIRSREVLPVGS